MANNIISKIDGKFLNDPSAIYKLTPNASTYTAQISDPTSKYSTTSIIRLPSDVMLNSSDGAVYSQKGHIHGVNISGTVSTVSAGTPTGTVDTPAITANNTRPSITRLTSISGSMSTTSTTSGGVLSTWTYNSANESLTFSRINLSATLNKTSTSMTVVTNAAPVMSANPIFYGNALAAHTHSFNVNGYATGEAIKANNKIIYLSSSGVIAPYDTTVFGASIVSNTCENGVGTILFNGNVTSIGNNAFYTRSALKGIIIPDTVTSFGNNAFSGCTSLSSINIPSSVTTIGDSAFTGCTSLPVENGIRYADTYLVEVISKASSAYTIKSSTRFIGINAFQNCINLAEISIPAAVICIGSNAFSGCTGLSSITSLNPVPPTIQSNTLQNVPATCPIYVPAESVNTYKSAPGWSDRAAYIQEKLYENVDYIQTDGYAYINTAILAATDMSMKGKFYLTNIADNFIVSARDGDNRFYLLNANNSAGLVCAKVNWSGPGACQSHSLAWNQWVEVESSVTTTGSTLKFNSVNISSSLSGSLSTSRNIYILGGDNKGTPSVAPNGCRVSYIKLYKNNILVFDGVAVKRLSDNKYGLLNSVDNQFYGNANSSGSFTGA